MARMRVSAMLLALALAGCASTGDTVVGPNHYTPLPAHGKDRIDGRYGNMFYYTDDDVELIGRTLWGEARSQDDDEMRAVANVVVNRLLDGRWGSTIREVIMFPFAFSCHNPRDRNRRKMMLVTTADPDFVRAMAIAREVLEGRSRRSVRDHSNGATHYHASYVRPRWANRSMVVARFDAHIFYSGVQDTRWEVADATGSFRRDLKRPTTRHHAKMKRHDRRVGPRASSPGKGRKHRKGRASARR